MFSKHWISKLYSGRSVANKGQEKNVSTQLQYTYIYTTTIKYQNMALGSNGLVNDSIARNEGGRACC